MLLGTQKINRLGHLEVGGIDTVELATQFGTPLYVMDEAPLRKRCREYLDSFRAESPQAIVAYASKAFLCRAMAAIVNEEGLHLDAASPGELAVALAGGLPPERIVLHGNYKKVGEVRAAMEVGVGTIVIDSFDELKAVAAIARELGRRQSCLIRVAPGIDPHTLDAISTGRNDTKFGLTVENGAALRAVEEARGLEGIDLDGIHAHIGSQILDLEPFDLLAERMLQFCDDLVRRTGWMPGLLCLGGGLGIRYIEDSEPPSVRDLARTLAGAVRRAAERLRLPAPRIGVEPGRSMVGDFGLTLYTVGPVKSVPTGDAQARTYVAIDGGLSDNPRPLMYGARYPALLANRCCEEPTQLVRVAGRHCETDTLLDIQLPLPKAGDILAVLSTGAYNHTMASNYNFFCRPPIVFVSGGRARLAVRRETEEDLLRRDVG